MYRSHLNLLIDSFTKTNRIIQSSSFILQQKVNKQQFFMRFDDLMDHKLWYPEHSLRFTFYLLESEDLLSLQYHKAPVIVIQKLLQSYEL